MIVFDNVTKQFSLERKGRVVAVKGLSLTINKSEVYGFIGPNGAGKSTTIKMLLNLIRPNQGTITINSHLSTENRSRTSVGYLPENPCLYDFLSAKEYLNYAGKLSGMNRKQITERSDYLLEKLKLDQACKRSIKTYSKGMQQRTAIAAALIHDPSLVILDEPMSGLDPLGRKLIYDLIAELKQSGKTVFISSHVLTDIERLCDRVGIIVQGRLSYEGRVSEIDIPLEELFLRVVNDTGVEEVK